MKNKATIDFKQSMIQLEKERIEKLESRVQERLCDSVSDKVMIESRKGIIRNLEASIERLKESDA